VAMLATTSGKRLFDVGENLDQTRDVTCAVDLFGPIDLTRLPSLTERLLGPENKNSQDLRRNASPISYVHEDEPPILIVHGTDDKLVPYKQAELLADAVSSAQLIELMAGHRGPAQP
jgi:dipeptidyl aminopeptidase/acylaminoacyl peptidase